MSNQSGTQAVDRAARLLVGGRALGRPDDVHRADRGHRAGQVAPPRGCCSRSSATGWSGGTTTAGSCPARCSSASPGAAAPRPAWSRWPSPSSSGSARPPARPINLGVASDGLVEQIAQVDSTYLIGGTNWVGLSVPLHCSALGKVLLAYGAAQLPASCRRPARAAHRQDHHQRGGAARRAGHRADPRLRRDRRGARARPDRGGRPRPRLRRRRGRGAVGVGPDDPDEPGRAAPPWPGTAPRRPPPCPRSSATGSEAPGQHRKAG